MAAFIPGASPPDVRTAIFLIVLIWYILSVFCSLLKLFSGCKGLQPLVQEVHVLFDIFVICRRRNQLVAVGIRHYVIRLGIDPEARLLQIRPFAPYSIDPLAAE